MASSQAQSEIKNRLLASLPAVEFDRVRPHLTCVELARGEVLHHPETRIEYVYFPESAVLSYIFSTEDGVSLEVGTVGNNGLANPCVAQGVDRTPNSAEVLIGGTARRMSASALRTEVRRGGTLAELLHAYVQATLVHSGQMQVCMRLHSLEERLAGWLLLIYDFNQQDTLPLTQAAIGQMLGVRRIGVSIAAGHLQTAGLLTCSRGRITIRDRQSLADFACNCAEIVKREYERVFSTP